MIYPRLFTGFGKLVFFTNLSVQEFQVRCFALFLLFSVIDSFWWFWIGSLRKSFHLMMEFLKAPFLALHFSNYTLMTFLMLSVILLSMLMILLSTLIVIKHLICGNNKSWLLNLNPIYETLWTGAGNGLLISMLEKRNKSHLTSLITLVLLNSLVVAVKLCMKWIPMKKTLEVAEVDAGIYPFLALLDLSCHLDRYFMVVPCYPVGIRNIHRITSLL